MKKILSSTVILATLIYSFTSNAEITTAEPSQASVVSTAPVSNLGARVIGGVEFRPSWTSSLGEVHSENWAQLGYQMNPNARLFYRQEFNTNVFNPGVSSQGLGLYANDGSFRFQWKDFAKLTSTLAASYESRLYLPTLAVKRNAGMVTSLRNHLKLTQNIGAMTSVSLEEVPILHIYNRAGNVSLRGVEANPIFENRLTLSFEIKPTTSLKFVLPLILHDVRFRDFQTGAKNNNSWSHKLWIYPELTYTVSPQLMIGLAYYSDNLVLTNFAETNVGAGLEKGITQLILNASL